MGSYYYRLNKDAVVVWYWMRALSKVIGGMCYYWLSVTVVM